MPIRAVAPTTRRIPSTKTPPTVTSGGRIPVHRTTTGPAKVFVVFSRPGGKGKTTTSSALAAFFALSDKATLLIELDDHARVYIRLIGTQRRNAKPLDLSRTSYALFFPNEYDIRSASFHIDMNETFQRSGLSAKVIDAVRAERGWHTPNALDVIPGSPSLRNIDGKFAIKEHEAAMEAQEFVPNIQVAESLTALRQAYDAIVIDTPANLTGLTWNGLMAAMFAFMPVGCEPDSIEDYDETHRTYEQALSICERLGRLAPQLIGYVGNFFDREKPLDRAIFQSYVGPHADPDTGLMVPAAIPYPMLGCLPLDKDALSQAMAKHMTVHTSAPQSEMGKAMYDFCVNAAKAGGY